MSAKKLLLTILTISVTLNCKSINHKTIIEHQLSASDSIILTDDYTVLEVVKTRTGHITTTILVNGKPCVFLIDTGGGATLIDKTKKNHFGLMTNKTSNYAAGIGSVSSLVSTKATLQVNDKTIKFDDLFLMDISYINAEFKKNRAKQVDGVIGTDFLDTHKAIIDYSRSKLYLKLRTK